MSAHPWSTVQYVLFYSLNARIFFQSLKCYTYYGPTDYQTNNRRVPAEFFPADIRLRFRLAVFFSADFRRIEIRRLIRISATAGCSSLSVCQSVRLSRSRIVSKRLKNIRLSVAYYGSQFFKYTKYICEIPTGSPLRGR